MFWKTKQVRERLLEGITCWKRNGVLRRDDGPAAIWPDGTERWFRDGKRHREGGPAVIYASGTRMWFCDGKYHREDGPAIEWASGGREWYRNDRQHRDGDEPAVEMPDGRREWWYDGQLHRLNGPAVERADGTTEWYRDGKRHRLDGPAVNGRGHEWWRFGQQYQPIGSLVADGPNGARCWFTDGRLHRDGDEPAIEHPDGKREWYQNGRRHRSTGPAIEKAGGEPQWYLRGIEVPEYVVTRPLSITACNITEQRNAEVRRVMIERMGPERFIAEFKPERVHEDASGILWRKQIGPEEIWTAVEVVNGTAEPDGSRKHYFLRVPPDTKRAIQGVSWTYGMSIDEYAEVLIRT